MRSRPEDHPAPLLPAALLSVLLAGCSHVAYYAQAISGHLDVMRASRPIADVMVDPASDATLREQLEQVQAIRDFASRELALPENHSYRTYADLERPYVVWNVFAAPELSLDPLRWCLLMVGCVSYHGYYDRLDAERFAAELRQQGYETFIGGVPAYSTLGHFADPVLNTFLRLGTLEVARTVFHELAHQLVFVPGDTQFNESFATAVENEGMRRWMMVRASPEQRSVFATQRARQAALARLMHAYHKEFAALYASDRTADQQRVAKVRLFSALRGDYADLKASWGGYAGYDTVFDDQLNNARLVALALYSELVPAFEALFERSHQDWRAFYDAVRQLAEMPKAQRTRELKRIQSENING